MKKSNFKKKYEKLKNKTTINPEKFDENRQIVNHTDFFIINSGIDYNENCPISACPSVLSHITCDENVGLGKYSNIFEYEQKNIRIYSNIYSNIRNSKMKKYVIC